MSRARKDYFDEQLKRERITIRIDEDLRKSLESFSKSGIYKGEDLQVIIRMLVRAGLEVEARVKEMRIAAIQEMHQKGATPDVMVKPSSAGGERRLGHKLMQEGILTGQEVLRILMIQEEKYKGEKRFGEVALELGLIDAKTLAIFVGKDEK